MNALLSPLYCFAIFSSVHRVRTYCGMQRGRPLLPGVGGDSSSFEIVHLHSTAIYINYK